MGRCGGCRCSGTNWNIEKLDKDTGEIIWRKSLPKKGNNGQPYCANIATLANGNIVVGAYFQNLVVCSPNGNVLYEVDGTTLPAHEAWLPWLDYNYLFIPPMIPRLQVSGNNIYVSTGAKSDGTSHSSILCFDEELNLLWHKETIAGQFIIEAEIFVFGGVLWVCCPWANYGLAKLSLTDGSEISGPDPVGTWSGPPFNQFIGHGMNLNTINGTGIYCHQALQQVSTNSTSAGAGFSYYPIQYLTVNGTTPQIVAASSDFIYAHQYGRFDIQKYGASAFGGTNLWAASPGQPQTKGRLGFNYGTGGPNITAMQITGNGDLLVSGAWGIQTTNGIKDYANVWCFDADSGALKWYHSQKDDEYIPIAGQTYLGVGYIWPAPYKTGQCEVDDGYIFVSQTHIFPSNWKSVARIDTTATATFEE